MEEVLQYGVDGMVTYWQSDSLFLVYLLVHQNTSKSIAYWLRHLYYINQVGTSETSNAIYWRARKVLNDSTVLDIPRS